MRVWGKKRETEFAPIGVARAALAGASRDELLRAALQALTREGNADRIGVWTEPDSDDSCQGAAPADFRGLIWDRENPENPSEWRNLSAAPPLPDGLLLGGKTVEEDLESFPERPITGQLLGIVRVERNERYRVCKARWWQPAGGHPPDQKASASGAVSCCQRAPALRRRE
jgi:hypothetical protein